MKEPTILSVSAMLAQADSFDAVIDARSPSEFAMDHLPGAYNAPVLHDEQREQVGTLHAKQGAFEAKRLGAALIARNISEHLEQRFNNHDRHWRPLVYCWRGGNRSGALATIMARIGWHTTVLAGGYKAFRRHVIDELNSLPLQRRFVVLAGPTGSAKTRLLQTLAQQGAAVLDLEALAGHRGSVLGQEPGCEQPSQKLFETKLWASLTRLPPDCPIFVESESRKIGQCQLPEALIQAIRAAPVVLIDAPAELRRQFLLTEYAHLCRASQPMLELLHKLVPQHGHLTIQAWQRLVEDGQWPTLVDQLLDAHYDPRYERSIQRNFRRYAEAPVLPLPDMGESALQQAATALRDLARTLADPALTPQPG